MATTRDPEQPLLQRSHTLDFDADKVKHAGNFREPLKPRSADQIVFRGNRKEFRKYEFVVEYGPRDFDKINHIYCRLYNISKKLPRKVKGLQDPEFRFCIIANDECSATKCARTIFVCTPTVYRINETILSKENGYGYTITIVYTISNHDEIEDLRNERIIYEKVKHIPEEYLFVFMDENTLYSEQQTRILGRIIPRDHFLSGYRITSMLDACQRFLLECIANLEQSLTLMSEKDSSYLFDRIKILKGRLNNREEKISLSETCMDLVKRQANLGVIGHVLRDGVLTLYIENKSTNWNSLLKDIKDNFDGKIETIFIDKRSLKCYSNVTSGEEILSPKGSGTLGMFGQLDGSPVAVTGGHVIEKGQLAQVHINGKVISFGTCIWPVVTECQTNIPDIAIIKMDRNILDRISYRIGDNVTIYTRRLLELKNRKVFKFGATTHLTRGYVDDINSMSLFDSTDVALVAHEDDHENFAREGDSGAIVLTKFNDQYFAVGVVYGGDLDPWDSSERISPKTTVIVSLNHAIQRFENHEVLKLDSL